MADEGVLRRYGFTEAYDKPRLAGKLLPGAVRLKGAGVELRMEKNKASGSDGGTPTIKGLEIPEFQFELEITLQAELEAWTALVPLILPIKDPKKRENKLPVVHPTLARFGIQWCVVKQVEETPPDQGGPLKATIKCLGASAPRPAKAIKPKAKAAQPSNVQMEQLPDKPPSVKDYVRRPSNNVKVTR